MKLKCRTLQGACPIKSRFTFLEIEMPHNAKTQPRCYIAISFLQPNNGTGMQELVGPGLAKFEGHPLGLSLRTFRNSTWWLDRHSKHQPVWSVCRTNHMNSSLIFAMVCLCAANGSAKRASPAKYANHAMPYPALAPVICAAQATCPNKW